MSTLPRRDLLRMTLAVAGGAVAASATIGTPAFLTPAQAAVTKIRLETPCTSQITQSTGNVYWSENYANEHPNTPSQTFRGTLWRASKHEVNDGRMLLSRYSSDYLAFGRPTWAKVGVGWWGFVSVDLSTRSEIWRFDLGDPEVAPTVIARSPRVVQGRWVEANGTHVYWVDAVGIHRAPVLGGAAQQFITGSNISNLQLDQSFLYYVLAGRHIVRVAVGGGSSSIVYSAAAGAAAITSLRVKSGWMVWADGAGAVKKRLASSGAIQSLQSSSGGSVAVDFDGTNTVYKYQYRHWTGDWMYQIISQASGRPNVSTRLFAAAGTVLADSTGFNWVEDGRLWRLNY